MIIKGMASHSESLHSLLSAHCLWRVRVVDNASEALKNAVLVVGTRPNTADTTDIKHAIENLERDTMGESWYAALQGEFKKPYFHKVSIFCSIEDTGLTVAASLMC